MRFGRAADSPVYGSNLEWPTCKNVGLLGLLDCHVAVLHDSSEHLSRELAEHMVRKGLRLCRDPRVVAGGQHVVDLLGKRCVPEACSTRFRRASSMEDVCWRFRLGTWDGREVVFLPAPETGPVRESRHEDNLIIYPFHVPVVASS